MLSISEIQPKKRMAEVIVLRRIEPWGLERGLRKKLDTITLPYCKLTHQREIISGETHSFKVYGKIEKKNVFILCEKQ